MAREERLRIGVVGGGVMARTHLASLLSIPTAEVVGLAAPEVSPEVAGLCQSAGIPVGADVRGLIGSDGLDALVIAAPTDAHVALVQLVAASGRHVFCEKPLALKIRDARSAVDACAAAGVRLAVGHVVRYFPAYAKLRDLVAAGEIGPPAMAKCRRMSGPPGEAREWYADSSRSGGVLTDMGVHDFDWLLWTLGPVTRVSASVVDRGAGQVAMVLFAHESGAISAVELSWMDPTGFWTAVEVSGPGGLLSHDSRTSATFRLERAPNVAPAPPSVEVPLGAALSDPYRDEMVDALAFFAGGAVPRSSPQDAVAAVALAEAARRAAEMQATIELKDVGS
ncbi:MAG: Gfo/Idh/MocA family oxidoreductase [Actinomycetota bacterium]|nr:Gfo/Idh/MocA family oxidoreductase [Actinomycetota bacterium]